MPWNETDFMEFLIKPSGKPIDNSFKGKRFKNKFLNQIQMEFAVCFPDDFYEKKWDLNKLAEYLESRTQNSLINLRMAQKRLHKSKHADINIFIFLNLLLIPPILALHAPYIWIYSLLPLVLNILLIRFKVADIHYHKMLIAKIDQAGSPNSAKPQQNPKSGSN